MKRITPEITDELKEQISILHQFVFLQPGEISRKLVIRKVVVYSMMNTPLPGKLGKLVAHEQRHRLRQIWKRVPIGGEPDVAILAVLSASLAGVGMLMRMCGRQ